jgi:hypothetical protein
MKISNSDNRFTLEVSQDELGILSNALNETLECIEEWEYQTRMGVSSETVLALLKELSRAYKSAGQGHFDS